MINSTRKEQNMSEVSSLALICDKETRTCGSPLKMLLKEEYTHVRSLSLAKVTENQERRRSSQKLWLSSKKRSVHSM